jgi:cytochrome b561
LLVAIGMLPSRLRKYATVMLSIGAVVLLLGILNLVLKSTLADPDPAENRIEWVAATLVQLWFFILFVAWRRTGADFSVRIRPAGD